MGWRPSLLLLPPHGRAGADLAGAGPGEGRGVEGAGGMVLMRDPSKGTGEAGRTILTD